eukprot:490832_1
MELKNRLININIQLIENTEHIYANLKLSFNLNITKKYVQFWKLIGFTVHEHDFELIKILSRHPLLVKHSQYETIEKTPLHRCVEELNMKHVLKEYLCIDSKSKIDYIYIYLLKQLMLHKSKILESDIFWKHVGRIINTSHTLIINMFNSKRFDLFIYKRKCIHFINLIWVSYYCYECR